MASLYSSDGIIETASCSSGLNSSPTVAIFSMPKDFQLSNILSKSASNLATTAFCPSVSTFKFCLAYSNSSAMGMSSWTSGTAALPRAAASSADVRCRKLSISSLSRECAPCFSSLIVLSSSISACSFSMLAFAASDNSCQARCN